MKHQVAMSAMFITGAFYVGNGWEWDGIMMIIIDSCGSFPKIPYLLSTSKIIYHVISCFHVSIAISWAAQPPTRLLKHFYGSLMMGNYQPIFDLNNPMVSDVPFQSIECH